MSDARITYEGMSDAPPSVDVSYADLGDQTPVAFVDEFGHRTAAGTLAGTGDASLPTAGLAPGKYYVSAGSPELCQTVGFYVAGAPDNL